MSSAALARCAPPLARRLEPDRRLPRPPDRAGGWRRTSTMLAASRPPVRAAGEEAQARFVARKRGAVDLKVEEENGADCSCDEDPGKNQLLTVGNSTNILWHECPVGKLERQNLLKQKGCVIWITGLSGSGDYLYTPGCSSKACTWALANQMVKNLSLDDKRLMALTSEF